VTLRAVVRRFLPRRSHPLLDAAITPAPRDAELRGRYAAAVAGESDVFVTQRFEEGLRWREVVGNLECGGHVAALREPGAGTWPPHSRKILDIGGGNGAIELAFSADPDAFAVSIDALWNTTARALGVRRVVADAAAMPFRADAFEAVLCLETIEHVRDPRAVAREIARVAASGAVVLVTTPAKWRYVLAPDPHFGIRFLTLLPPPLQRRLAARRGFTGPHHFVDRIYGSVAQLRRLFRELTHETTLVRDRLPGYWFWDAVVFRKRS
jgi:SAM-dependent methyltransferase